MATKQRTGRKKGHRSVVAKKAKKTDETVSDSDLEHLSDAPDDLSEPDEEELEDLSSDAEDDGMPVEDDMDDEW